MAILRRYAQCIERDTRLTTVIPCSVTDETVILDRRECTDEEPTSIERELQLLKVRVRLLEAALAVTRSIT